MQYIRGKQFYDAYIKLSPSRRREALFGALARGEGTNSALLFTPGKTKALAKSEVHQ
jgi:hypothetical protein